MSADEFSSFTSSITGSSIPIKLFEVGTTVVQIDTVLTNSQLHVLKILMLTTEIAQLVLVTSFVVYQNINGFLEPEGAKNAFATCPTGLLRHHLGKGLQEIWGSIHLLLDQINK